MSLEAIENLLRQKIGIDTRVINYRQIAIAAKNRCSTFGLSNVEDYFKLLQTSPQEFEEVVEQIVVPETYFFRDRKPFDFLVNHVRTNCLSASNQTKLRLLSVPCSSGEEAYSMAIALLEAGLPRHRFRIDAMDISKSAIAKAQRAIYGKNSFRGEDWIERNRYFQKTKEGYEVIAPVRNSVNFRTGNLLEAFSTTQVKYDIIFCRNLMIYLESAACQQVLNILDRLLLPNGLLFVGASETGKVPSERFTSIRQSFTFAYHKIDRIQSQSPRLEMTSVTQLDTSSILANNQTRNKLDKQSFSLDKQAAFPVDISRFSASEDCLETTQSTTPETVDTSSKISLMLAKQLADTGQIEAALFHCQEYLKRDLINAEAYTLLATLHQTKAKYTQAEMYFKKAIYLNPKCYEALKHLALLKESQGDIVSAKILQQRIQRLQQTSHNHSL